MLSDYLMGPLKRYLTQTLSSSLSKYISNINVETLGVGGDIILRDLELRLDVLQESLKIPLAFEFSRGFIKELRIQIHWTKLMSQPIHVKVSTIEIILTARSEIQFRRLQLAYQRHSSKHASGKDLDNVGDSTSPRANGDQANGVGSSAKATGATGGSASPASRASPGSSASAAGTAAPGIGPGVDTSEGGGWLHDAIRKIIANATVEINDLVLKYEHANVVLSTSFRSLRISSADPDQGWKVAFQEPQGIHRSIFKSIDVRDLTINLDRISHDSARRISFGTSITPRQGALQRRSTSGSSAEEVLFGSPSRRRPRSTASELPVLRRASIAIRARVSTDPFASRYAHAAAGDDDHSSVSHADFNDREGIRNSSSTSSLQSSARAHARSRSLESSSSRLKMHRSSSEAANVAKLSNSGSGTNSNHNNNNGGGSGGAKGVELPDTSVDPFKGVPCLLPLLCEEDTALWRARSAQDPEHAELDWAVLSVVDVHVRKVDLSVSNEQFIMLEELMVLPTDDDDSDNNDKADTDDDSGESGDGDVETSSSSSSSSSSSPSSPSSSSVNGNEDEPQQEVKEELRQGLEASAAQQQNEDLAEAKPDTEAKRAEDGGGWGGWAWGVLVGDVEQELDDVEVEMLYDAAETAKRREAARLKAIQLARERKRLVVVAGARIDSVSFSFLVHKEGRDPKFQHQRASSPLGTPFGAPEENGDNGKEEDDEGDDDDDAAVVSVPVANVGMVQVRLDRSQAGSSQRKKDAESGKLDELLCVSVQGVTVEARKVDDLMESKSKAFLDVYADVDIVRISRYEPVTSTYHDVALWGESVGRHDPAPSPLLDPMPHPWFCWSFFHNATAMASYPEHCEKDCCVGSSLYRRSDKALRMHCHAPAGKLSAPESRGNASADTGTPALASPTASIFIDAAVGPVSCRLDLLTVEGIYEFFGLSAASPDDLATHPSLPELRKGTAGAALKELAAEYASLTRPQQLKFVSRPIEALATFPRVVGSLSTVPPGATREDPHPCLGVLVRDTVLRFGANLHRADRGVFAVAKGAPTPPISLFPPHVFDQLTHRATEVSRTDRKTTSGQASIGHATVFLAQRPSMLEHKPRHPHQLGAENNSIGSSGLSSGGGGGGEEPAFDAVLVQLVRARALLTLVAPVDSKEAGRKARVRMDLARFLAQANLVQVCQAVEVVGSVLRPISSAAAAPVDPLFLQEKAALQPGVALNLDTLRCDANLDGLAKGLASMAFSLGGLSLQCRGTTVASVVSPQEKSSAALSGHVFGEGHPVTAALQRIKAASRFLSRSVVARFHIEQRSREARLGFGGSLGPSHLDAVGAHALLEWSAQARSRVADILRIYVGQDRNRAAPAVREVIPIDALEAVTEEESREPVDVIESAARPRRSSSLLPWIQGTRVFMHVDVREGEAHLASNVFVKVPCIRLLQNGREHNDFRWNAGPFALCIRSRHGLKYVLRDAHFHGACSCALGEAVELKLSVNSEQIQVDLDPERLLALNAAMRAPIFRSKILAGGRAPSSASAPASDALQPESARLDKSAASPQQDLTDWPVVVLNMQGELAGFHVNLFPLARGDAGPAHANTPYQVADDIDFAMEHMQFSLWKDHGALAVRVSVRDLYAFERMRTAAQPVEERDALVTRDSGLRIPDLPSQALGLVISFLSADDVVALASTFGIPLWSSEKARATKTLTDVFSVKPQAQNAAFFDSLDTTIPIVCSPAIHEVPTNKPTLLTCAVSKPSGGRLLVEGGLLPLDFVLRPGLAAGLLLLATYLDPPFGRRSSRSRSASKSSPRQEKALVHASSTSHGSGHGSNEIGNGVRRSDAAAVKWPQVQLQVNRLRVFVPFGEAFVPSRRPARALVFACDALRASQTPDGVGASCTVGPLSMSACTVEPVTAPANAGESSPRSPAPSQAGSLESFYAFMYHQEPAIYETPLVLPFSVRMMIGPSGHVEIDCDGIEVEATLSQIESLQTLAKEVQLLSNPVCVEFLQDPALEVGEALFRRVLLAESTRDSAIRSASDSSGHLGSSKSLGKAFSSDDLTDGNARPRHDPAGRPFASLVARVPGVKASVQEGRTALVLVWASQLRLMSSKDTVFEVQEWGIDAGGHANVVRPGKGPSAALSVSLPQASSLVLEFTRGVLVRLDAPTIQAVARLARPPSSQQGANDEAFRALERMRVFRKARDLVAAAQEDAIPDEEASAGAPVKVSTKVVLAALDAQITLSASPASPGLCVQADQVFLQQSLRIKRSEFEVVVIRPSLTASIAPEREVVMLEPTDLRLTGTAVFNHSPRVSLAIETASVDTSISLESLATAMAIAKACTPSWLAQQTAARRRLQPGATAAAATAAAAARQSPYFAAQVLPKANDFAHLKRIYEMGDSSEYVHPAPGQIVLGSLGVPGSVVGVDCAWNAANKVDAARGLEAGGQWNQTFGPLSASAVTGWVTLRWHYFEPRMVSSVGLLHPPPIPRGVAEAAIHPSGVEAGLIECQLAYWDDIRTRFVVVAAFNVPLEPEALSSSTRRAAVEEFVDAFSTLVDMSMVEDARNGNNEDAEEDDADANGAKKELRASSFPRAVRKDAAAKLWVLRWRATEATDQKSLAIDDRLAVCSALVRSLKVQSKCSISYWAPVEIRVSAKRFRVAVLRQAALNSRHEEMLFVARARNFNVLASQNARIHAQVRVNADLDVHVQDFGNLALLHFVRVHHLAIMHEMRAASRTESVWVDCRHWRWNISKQTLPAVHFAVLTFARDMETLLHRRDEIVAANEMGTKPMGLESRSGSKRQEARDEVPAEDDGASLQYRVLNSTGRTVWFGQYGTAEVLRVDADGACSYSWRVTGTHLMPHAKDQGLLRRGEGGHDSSKVDATLQTRIERAADFVPLMRFALSSGRSDNEPGTWSQPTSIDNIGVHLRSVVFGGVNKNERSVFFGNEPQGRLWVSAQRGENGLQTIVRLLPSHFIVNRVPEPLQIRFASANYELPACNAEVLRETFVKADSHDEKTDLVFEGIDLPQLQRMGSLTSVGSIDLDNSDAEAKGPAPSGTAPHRPRPPHSGAQGGGAETALGDHSPVGFIDERDVDFAFAGAGTLALMCPDVDLLASRDEEMRDRANRELSIQIGRQIDWSPPISLLKVDGKDAPQLVEVPGPLGVPSMWLWVHVRRAHIRGPQGGRLRAWVMVEIWPTVYVCNDAPWPLLCEARPQNRLDLLQYAMGKQENDFHRGDWPLAKDLRRATQRAGEVEGADDATQGDGTASPRRAQKVAPHSIAPLFLHPTRAQTLVLARVPSDSEAVQWLSPALRIHEPFFANCIAGFGASVHATEGRVRMRLARHAAQLDGGYVNLQAWALSGFASLFVRAEAPMRLRNESKDRVYFRYGDEVVCVETGEDVPVAWSLDHVENAGAICLGRDCLDQEQSVTVWSSPLPLSDDDQHIVAIPVLESVKMASNAAWVSQYWCEMARDVEGRVLVTTRDRIQVHNRMQGPVRIRVESPFSEALDLVEVGAGETWSPMSFFCDVSADSFPGRTEADEERDEPASKGDPVSVATTPVGERRASGFSTWILNRSQRSASASSVSSLLGIGGFGDKSDDAGGGFPERKLLSTVLRFNTAVAPERWTDAVPVTSLEVAQGWKQLVQLHVGATHVETITCVCNEVDGIVHVALQRETQPECIVMNRSEDHISVGLGLPASKSKWKNAAGRAPCWGLCLAPGHSATVNWLALTKRIRRPLFEVMRQSGDENANGQSGASELGRINDGLQPSGAGHVARGAPSASAIASDGLDGNDGAEEEEEDAAELARQLHRYLVRRKLVRDDSLCFIEADDPAWLRKPSEVFESQHKKDNLLLFQRHAASAEEGSGVLDGTVREIDVSEEKVSPFAHSTGGTRASRIRGSAESDAAAAEGDSPITSAPQGADGGPLVAARYLQREAGTKALPLEGFVVTMSRPHAWWEMVVEDAAGEEEARASESPDGQNHGSGASGRSKRLQVLATVADVEICLFDRSLETVHLRVAGLEVSHVMRELLDASPWRDKTVEQTVACRAQWVQADSFVPESEIPVVLHFVETEEESEDEVALCRRGYDDPLGVTKAQIGTWAVRDRILAGASWTEVTCAGHKLPKQFGKINLRLAPISVAVEDALLKRLAVSLMPIAATLIAQQKLVVLRGNARARTASDATACPAELMDVDDRIFIETLVIGELSVVATVRTTTLPMFVGIDRTPLRFSEVSLVRVFEGAKALRNELLANYIADALLGSPALLGSLEILGNPVGFARSVGAGVYDLFFQPLKAIRHGYGPGGVLRGVARGWSSLLIHLSEGALMSVSGFSNSIARNLDRLSLDAAYASRREQMRRRRTYSGGGPMALTMRVSVMLREALNEQEETLGYWNTADGPEELVNYQGGRGSGQLQDWHQGGSSRQLAASRESMRFGTARGLARGVVGLGQGMLGAATGIVVQPFEVAAQQGWGVGSVLQGVGRGLLGALTKPIGGAADLVAQTSGGIMQDAGIGAAAGPPIMRERSVLTSLPHHSLRFNWKLLPQSERYVHHERALLQTSLAAQERGQFVLVVVTTAALRLFSVYDGVDTLPMRGLAWSEVTALETSFRDTQLLTVRILPSAGKDLVLVFASKQDRRLLVKEAVTLQRQASAVSH